MAASGATRPPKASTLPQGDPVASYATYLEAQRAVDLLADKAFPVELVTIVGTDLRMVERVTGRLSYPRVALAGLATGAWFGLFVGLLLVLFSPAEVPFPLLTAILIGAAFGMLFSVITYSFTGGKRDFTSASQIVATSYTLLCRGEKAHQARGLLLELGGVTGGFAAPAVEPPPAPSTPPAGEQSPNGPPPTP